MFHSYLSCLFCIMKFLLCSLFILNSCINVLAQDSQRVQIGKAYNYKANAVNPNFPFIVGLTTVEYDITINLNDQKIIDTYNELFKQNKLPFTAESWEELVTGLYNNDSEMHHQVITSAQKNVLRIGTGGKEYQEAFLHYMLPIFSDTKQLDGFLKKED